MEQVIRNDNYLMHHGVKGMKWGVRHDPIRVGRNRGQRVVDGWNGGKTKTKKERDRRKYIRNALFGIAAVSAATVVGLEVYKLGKMSTDTVLRKGTLAQSVAISEKTDFGKSFYAATSQDDRRNILKKFSGVLSKQAKESGLSGSVHSNMFVNDKNVKIAGRSTMKKAYKSVYGTKKGFFKYARDFNQFDQAKREPFMRELKRRGYGGFKDQAGMQKWWGGTTPIVLNGSDSGFRLRNRAKINPDRLSNVPVKDVGTKLRNTEERGLKVAKYTLAAGVGAQSYITISNHMNRNQNKGKRKKAS